MLALFYKFACNPFFQFIPSIPSPPAHRAFPSSPSPRARAPRVDPARTRTIIICMDAHPPSRAFPPMHQPAFSLSFPNPSIAGRTHHAVPPLPPWIFKACRHSPPLEGFPLSIARTAARAGAARPQTGTLARIRGGRGSRSDRALPHSPDWRRSHPRVV